MHAVTIEPYKGSDSVRTSRKKVTVMAINKDDYKDSVAVSDNDDYVTT